MQTHERIGFKRHLRPEIVPGEAVYLFAEGGVTALQGPRVELLASLLDGSRDVPALFRDLPDDLPPEQAGRLLARLGAAGLIGTRAGEEPGDPAALAYWEAAGLDAVEAVRDTRGARVRVRSVGDTAPERVVSALRRAELDVTVDAAGAAADLSVVVCPDYLAPELEAVDAEQRRAGRPWLLVKPTGAQVWVGPIFTPGNGACWRCLATRLAANRPAEAHVQASRGRSGPVARPDLGLHPVASSAGEVAALEAAKWLAGYRHRGQREIWAFDTFELKVSHHRVQALPHCPTCGDPGLTRRRALRPVTLESRVKRSVDGGGHRAASPQEVLDRYRHLVSPVTGVIRDIQRDTRGHELFNSYRSGTNVAAAAPGIDGLRSTVRCDNGGKGVTPLHAEVSALCEALERYSGTHHGDEATVRASFRALGAEAVHPDAFQLYHPHQFANRATWNAEHASFQHVPEPFDEGAELDWTPVWSMTRRCHRLLPTGSLYYGAPAPASITADSNGCAAGSSREDAVLQGLLEVIERDAVALWWYNRTPMPGFDLAALGDPLVDELREAYRELGRELWVLDLTADLAVPVAVAITRRIDGPREDIMFGFGAHLDPRLAVRRALTELNQAMPSVLGLRERDWSGLDVDLRRWLRTATVANQPYLLPSSVRPLPGYLPTKDLRADVRLLQERLEDAGLELLVLDQTRPDVGLAVVKVIVPGMRHFWSRLAPGRLYDVPVHLGRIERPAALDELNPVPMFM
ncbi:TOMM precursor leader peptide-binding protein [Amycolatopsis cihanbeyliensis]|uniref:Ribosomal protein S12 methylthiotransferase accessory factor n=1 Tax=Amycolatopsis cihanbeyliensis TaxID=1128664 RepID=A0A542DQ03_AMYCI|nr:TOMM precursor leader peptide-binding protein [Amycolatopsis cihanbeyliensis]TQJ05147.1 ribosomal protein S12 methylthiotransferase accessory factor [Amycolatopsis cihanbeyliensis]